jgi:hypothetical protein
MCKRITISPVWWWWQCIKRCKKSEETFIFSKKNPLGEGEGGNANPDPVKLKPPLSMVFKGEYFFGFFFFIVHYSALLHLPPFRFHCADGCWD